MRGCACVGGGDTLLDWRINTEIEIRSEYRHVHFILNSVKSNIFRIPMLKVAFIRVELLYHIA